MSSACECHIEGAWCFYCEMYVPVEKERDQFRSQLAEMIVRYNNDKNTFYKALELDGALREIRKIAQDADMHVIVTLIDQVLGKEQPKPESKKDDGQMDLLEVLAKG